MSINRKLAATILLAALEFKNGDRSTAKALLIKAAEDEDFDDTMDGMGEALSDDDFDSEDDDAEVKDEMASIFGRKRKPVKASEMKVTPMDDDQDSPGDTDDDNDEELRGDGIIKEMSKVKQVRANLIALASI